MASPHRPGSEALALDLCRLPMDILGSEPHEPWSTLLMRGLRRDYIAPLRKAAGLYTLGGRFCGCPKNKSPTTWGLEEGP